MQHVKLYQHAVQRSNSIEPATTDLAFPRKVGQGASASHQFKCSTWLPHSRCCSYLSLFVKAHCTFAHSSVLGVELQNRRLTKYARTALVVTAATAKVCMLSSGHKPSSHLFLSPLLLISAACLESLLDCIHALLTSSPDALVGLTSICTAIHQPCFDRMEM